MAGSPRSSESEQGVERVAERGQGVSPGELLAAARPSDVLQSHLSEGELGPDPAEYCLRDAPAGTNCVEREAGQAESICVLGVVVVR